MYHGVTSVSDLLVAKIFLYDLILVTFYYSLPTHDQVSVIAFKEWAHEIHLDQVLFINEIIYWTVETYLIPQYKRTVYIEGGTRT